MSVMFRNIERNFYCKLIKSTYYKTVVNDINSNLVNLEYAVRGPIVERATHIQKELAKGVNKNFSSVIRCNIGDCHASGQKPITFIRDVVNCASNNNLLNNFSIPDDAKAKAIRFLNSCNGSVGTYSQSCGVEIVREDVAKYIEERDNLTAYPKNIFLTSGASEGAKLILQLFANDKSQRSGIMVPIPQYPLYSATNAEFNAYQINYYLDESNNWELSIDHMEESIAEAKSKCKPRVLVLINPGNPTGQLFTKKTMSDVLEFAYRHSLVVIADEVYQHNVYTKDRGFVSFKRALHDLGSPISNELQMASLMSCSKGYMGECGFRAGYCELTNFDPDVQDVIFKCLTIRLCSNVLGQLVMDVVVDPPKPGDPSFTSFSKEKQTVLDELALKADLVTRSLNSIPGYKCNPITGAMYAFPQIELPSKAIELAKSKNIEPDFMYCLELLEEYGVCVVPGSGFGQLPGTYHFRITILPSVEKMKSVVEYIKEFHTSFMNKYG